MKILTIYDKSAPKYIRCLLPCFLMPGVELIVAPDLSEEQLDGVDIVFVNRLIMNKSINDVEKLREKYGFKLIVDNDDDWSLDPHHLLYNVYHRGPISEGIRVTMQVADYCTVTHERLAEKVSKENPNVAILPNAIPKYGQYNVKKQESDFIRLFWAGGSTHKKDIELLRNPLKRFDFKETMMVFGGYSPNHPEYSPMVSAFTNGGKLRHSIIKAVPVEEYYTTYAHCDIALVPLLDTPFNSNKSNLKILEAANIAAPVVVSNVHPYKDIPFVNYVNNKSDWYFHVKRLIKDKELMKEQGLQLQDWVNQHYNFEKINQERKQLFEYVTGKQAKIREIQGEIRTSA